MLSSYILALAVAGGVHAATPTAFEPASSGNLIVAFGSQLATNGVNIPRASMDPANFHMILLIAIRHRKGTNDRHFPETLRYLCRDLGRP
jgi:hypothetical protein